MGQRNTGLLRPKKGGEDIVTYVKLLTFYWSTKKLVCSDQKKRGEDIVTYPSWNDSIMCYIDVDNFSLLQLFRFKVVNVGRLAPVSLVETLYHNVKPVLHVQRVLKNTDAHFQSSSAFPFNLRGNFVCGCFYTPFLK